MRKVEHALDVATAPGAGSAFVAAQWEQKWVQLGGSFAGGCSLTVQFTLNGIDWVDAAPAQVGPAVIAIVPVVHSVRVYTNAYGGAPTATITGFDRRVS